MPLIFWPFIHNSSTSGRKTQLVQLIDLAEVRRLQTIIPEIRPLIQRLIGLSTELDKRTGAGPASPSKKWRP